MNYFRTQNHEVVFPRPPIVDAVAETVVESPPIAEAHSESSDVPQDFIDPLTCEIMSLPIILPSGYTIDQHTLDRYGEIEKTWGRKVSDPFTGLMLNNSNSPVINHLLKERIDRHTLIHGVSVGRTTGRKRPIEAIEHNINSENQSSRKRKPAPVESATKPGAPSTSSAQHSKPDDNSDKTIKGRLSSVLAKASSFRTVELLPKQTTSCTKCDNATPNAVFYKLGTCQHLVCKSCLVTANDKDKITCDKCAMVTLRSQVTRHHPS